jgi:large subunit ribosomal protein L15
MIQQHTLQPHPRSTHRKKRKGRGDSAGQGSFSGRGCKGQLARTGKKIKPWFEGGQTSFMQKIPKNKGFKPIHKQHFLAVNVSSLNVFDDGEIVTTETLFHHHIISRKNTCVKILGNGELNKKVHVQLPVSASAKEKIEKVGGTVTTT